jgi:asparagine synthase (glutamine-hydrolysing)
MQNLLTPYGRDAQHRWQQNDAALLRTLLRTTPEDSLDHQPLEHATSRTHLVFDGRIDNREELAHDLGLSRAETALMADSALALQACLRWDTQAVTHLLGDFALACWQPLRKRLWLARDPLGHRPLFWHKQPDFFAFATMPKALFAIPGIPRVLCEERLHDFICLLPMVGPESFYKDVYRVEPGQLLVLEGNQVTPHRYHTFDPESELHLPSDDDYLEAFREHLDRAVACRLRANGPIASHLSSGFDSSTITAIAARQLAQEGKSLLAYTAVPREGYDGPAPKGKHVDEGPGAQALAARFPNIEHILIRSGATSPLCNLQDGVEMLDRPPLNPANKVWGDAIKNDAETRGVKVLLTGQMGNLTISHTGEPYLTTLLGCGKWIDWWKEASALKQAQAHRRWRGLVTQSLTPYIPAALWEVYQKLRGRHRHLTDYTAIHPKFMTRMKSMGRAQAANHDLGFRLTPDDRRMRITELKRVDSGENSAAANAYGLDMRDPTSDRRLVEFCLAVPESQYLNKGQTRWLLQRLMKDILPPEILLSRSRGLQAADWHEAAKANLQKLNTELARLKTHGGADCYLDLVALERLLKYWTEGCGPTPETINAYRLKLLRGLSAGTFLMNIDNKNH